MDRLLGQPGDQILESEKMMRLVTLAGKQRELIESKAEQWLDEFSDIEKQLVDIHRRYPDLPPETPIATIVSLTQTCSACPSQWEGKTANGEEVYVRYRWGHLNVDIDGVTKFSKQLDYGDDHFEMEGFGRTKGEWKKSDEIMKKMNGGFISYAGTLTFGELVEATMGWFVWHP